MLFVYVFLCIGNPDQAERGWVISAPRVMSAKAVKSQMASCLTTQLGWLRWLGAGWNGLTGVLHLGLQFLSSAGLLSSPLCNVRSPFIHVASPCGLYVISPAKWLNFLHGSSVPLGTHKWELPGLLKAYAWHWHSTTSNALSCLGQVTGAARTQGKKLERA